MAASITNDDDTERVQAKTGRVPDGKETSRVAEGENRHESGPLAARSRNS